MASTSVPKRPRIASSALSGILLVVFTLAAMVIPVQYVVETPGPVFNTLGKMKGSDKDVVEISGVKTYSTDGQLDMLTVGVVGGPGRVVFPVRAAMGVLNDSETVVPTESLYPLNTTRDQVTQQNAAQMTSSQDIATAAALSELDMDFDAELRVAEDPVEGPAVGKVKQGDVLISINDKEVTGVDALATVHKEVERNAPVTLKLGSESGERTETITPTMIDGTPRMGVLLTQKFDFPIDVKFNLQDVGGPSAGTVFALTIIDKLTEGELTGDKKIAGTGAIAVDGTVQPIGGARQKVIAAEKAGNKFFLSPRDNCAEAAAAAADRDIKVVRIDSLHSAKTAVENIAADKTSDLPSCSADR